MRRRQFLAGTLGAAAAPRRARPMAACCGPGGDRVPGRPPGAEAFAGLGSRLRVTGMKVFGVSLTPDSDPPNLFVKLETDQGLVGWGEATLEGKAGAVMACLDDFREFVLGCDPMQVEHHWQSMYVHSFYRAGPVIGSAISGIDQALWDLRGKALGLPVHELLGGPIDPRGVRGYYHAEATTHEALRETRARAAAQGITCFKSGLPGVYEWVATPRDVRRAAAAVELLRGGLGFDVDIGVDFHAKTSPAVASAIIRAVEPLGLLFVEEPCPPENVQAMARIARRSSTPIATGERLIASFGCRELLELGAVDILQPDINHAGGITALLKIGAMAEISGVAMAPHACEGPIGGLATLAVDAAMPNFLVQEVCSFIEPGAKEKVWEEWLGFPAMRMVGGRFPLSRRPGLGFELREEALHKYPFGGTRPMARVFHQDGSVAEW